MLGKLNNNKDFDSENLIVFIYNWRKPLLIISAVAFVISIIVSLSITPKYKSTVIMYPAATSSISKALISKTTDQKQDVLQFGEDEEAEQMLQILNSSAIRDRVIEKFNLADHYGVDEQAKYKLTQLYNTYKSNISFTRTEYMAVKISVLDHDPQMAADIANDIANLLDSTKNAIQKDRALQAFLIVEEEYEKRKAEIRMMEDSLTVLRKLGVHDYKSQAEMINQQLAVEIAKGNAGGVAALEKKFEVLAKYGSAYESLSTALEYEYEQITLLKAKYDEAKIDAEKILPQKFVVDYAYKSEQKSYPIRWLIVVISTLAAFFSSLLIIAMIDSIAAYNKKKALMKE